MRKPYPMSTLARPSLAAALLLLLVACANPALRQSEELIRAYQLNQADTVLAEALRTAPADQQLRAAQLRLHEQMKSRLIVQIEGLRLASRWDEAQQAVQQLREVDAKNPRLASFDTEIERGRRQEQRLKQGRQLLREGKLAAAEAQVREILIESPGHAGARQLQGQIAQARPLEASSSELGPAFQKPVSLEFRDATLRQVFEALVRASNLNFVFDKDVRADAKVTLSLKNVSVDEAMRIILTTQQLDRKLLNDNSVLIFPNSQGKQREHQELVTRTLYLTNADVKQVQAMVRTIAKVRDIHIDERLNLMVVRDTPEVVRLVEKLIASIDLPEPEVMLEVEVLEIASDRVDALGLDWPEQVNFGLIGGGATVPLSAHRGFRASIANPALTATLKGSSGDVNLLANPKIRVRNREKARVQIGQKVPVFTTTTNFNGQTQVAASVSYLDVGLKLDVEPTIQLDNDVVIKVGLEVSSLLDKVTGPGDTTAYKTGTRQTSTTLRLNDGETQILAGLINDEDRRSSAGVPGLSAMPLLGRLFGVQTDTRNKTEVILLITPRVVRNLALPDAGLTQLAGGNDASPGAFSSLLRPSARAAVGISGSAAAAPRPVAEAPANAEVLLKLEVTPQVPAGGTISVTVRHDSGFAVKGELEYDGSRLAPAQIVPGAVAGRMPFELTPRGERALVLRALPAASGQVLNIGVGALSASGVNGEAPPVRLEGSGLVSVEAAK
ncbi:secretin and TonB N-terminal domain-containing protein [Paucibacter sp. APW11]|uniref:Secretin and TonB N-terminal domain-containing protein n=1 Tax=Roseateles aquae TaxID=3077235 RepID=A0ABU3PE72_9BURK|nr:secretin and TonB N-terminal domain-containing protein [Paucibacter sp. APW11]MDT9000917.1 secretin and TonB N-terminal domain-containing protein [Paucibacter sp. APW11]